MLDSTGLLKVDDTIDTITDKFDACSFNFTPPVDLTTIFLSKNLIPALSSKIETKVFKCSRLIHSEILDGYGKKVFDAKASVSSIIGLVPSLITESDDPATCSFVALFVIKYSEGLSIEIIPFSVIEKNPISPLNVLDF